MPNVNPPDIAGAAKFIPPRAFVLVLPKLRPPAVEAAGIAPKLMPPKGLGVVVDVVIVPPSENPVLAIGAAKDSPPLVAGVPNESPVATDVVAAPKDKPCVLSPG